jgi:acetoin utilization deacetylase AcuC-like enzyme
MLAKTVFIYSEKYDVDIGEHVFPTEKYALVRDGLIASGNASAEEFLEPTLPSDEHLLRVHTREFLSDLKNLRWTYRTMSSELPLTREIVDAYILCAGGTVLACREALSRRCIALHIGGGFHHAFADHAEGFCYINDVAVGIRAVQAERLPRKAFVIDCDLHQGNGTAHIFRDDPSVFTFSIHQENNYPLKQKSDLDIGLDDFVGDDVYLRELGRVIPAELDKFSPDIIMYVAGADPYEHDRLGSLRLTMDGLRARDEMVFSYCRERGIPAAVVLAGGYAFDTRDTVRIHLTTCLSALGIPRSDTH